MEIEKLFEKYRKIIEQEKEYKYTKITIEELNDLNNELIKLREENEKLLKENEKLSTKLEEAKSRAVSWCSKYNALATKEKKEIYKELEEKTKDKLYDDIKRKVDFDIFSERKRLEREYRNKEINLHNKIVEEVNIRVSNLGKIKEEFLQMLNNEMNRYTEKHELEENERNQGYLIGIAKTRKTLAQEFDKYIPNDISIKREIPNFLDL